MTSHYDLSEFVKAVNNQLKRISKDINITETRKPLKFVYNTIRFAIDALLEEKKKLELVHRSLSEKSFSKSQSLQNIIRTDDTSLYKEIKNLQDILSRKENHISSLESELDTLKNNFLEQQNIFYTEKKQQQEKIENLLLAQENVGAAILETEASQQQALLMADRVLNKFTEKLINLQQTVEKIKKTKKEKKYCASEENFGNTFLFSPIIRMESEIDKFKTSREEKIFRGSLKEFYDNDKEKSSFVSGSCKNSCGLEGLFEEVIKQIEVYNEEVDERENMLAMREEALIEEQFKLNINMGNFHSIVKNLQTIKAEIQVFNNEYLNEKDSLLENMQLVLHTLKEMVYDIGEKPNGQSNSYLETNSRKFELSLIKIPEVPDEALKIIEEKIIAIEKKEKELELVLRENARTTEYLNDAKEKINEKYKSLEEKEEEMNAIQFSLEQEAKNFQAKENSLLKLKKELDKRTIQLNIKEKQIETKFVQLNELQNT